MSELESNHLKNFRRSLVEQFAWGVYRRSVTDVVDPVDAVHDHLLEGTSGVGQRTWLAAKSARDQLHFHDDGGAEARLVPAEIWNSEFPFKPKKFPFMPKKLSFRPEP